MDRRCNIKRTLFLKNIFLVLFLAGITQAQANICDEKTEKQFSKTITTNLQSDNQGIQLSALMHIIRYTDQIDFACAHNEVMNIFLFDKNSKVRQLALTALHKINDRSDMDFLLKQMDFEKDPEVLKHLTAVLIDRERLHFIPRDSEQRMAILPSN